MGWVRFKFHGVDVEVPLSPSTRVGRHWSNDVVVPELAMPLYWVELRWFGDHWRFRCLAGEGRTRVKGARVGEWVMLRASSGTGSRVTLEQVGYFELFDDGAPFPFLVDMETGQRMMGSEVEDLLAQHKDLEEGATVHWCERLCRAEGVADLAPTPNGHIDMKSPECHIDVDLSSLQARVSQGHAQVMLEGEPVRTLAVYVTARDSDLEDGWLNSVEAYAEWVELGGTETSPIARIGWERGKLRSALSKLGVDNTKDLFAVRRRGAKSAVRLGLKREQVRLL